MVGSVGGSVRGGQKLSFREELKLVKLAGMVKKVELAKVVALRVR